MDLSHSKSICWSQTTCWCVPSGESGARAATVALADTAKEPDSASLRHVRQSQSQMHQAAQFICNGVDELVASVVP